MLPILRLDNLLYEIPIPPATATFLWLGKISSFDVKFEATVIAAIGFPLN
jgi:hypothetical protein